MRPPPPAVVIAAPTRRVRRLPLPRKDIPRLTSPCVAPPAAIWVHFGMSAKVATKVRAAAAANVVSAIAAIVAACIAREKIGTAPGTPKLRPHGVLAGKARPIGLRAPKVWPAVAICAPAKVWAAATWAPAARLRMMRATVRATMRAAATARV